MNNVNALSLAALSFCHALPGLRFEIPPLCVGIPGRQDPESAPSKGQSLGSASGSPSFFFCGRATHSLPSNKQRGNHHKTTTHGKEENNPTCRHSYHLRQRYSDERHRPLDAVPFPFPCSIATPGLSSSLALLRLGTLAQQSVSNSQTLSRCSAPHYPCCPVERLRWVPPGVARLSLTKATGFLSAASPSL